MPIKTRPVSNSITKYLGEILRLAIPAFAAQNQPGKKRYVVVKMNMFAAGRARRRRLNEGLISRNAVNNNVQKTADAAADSKKKYYPEPHRQHYFASLHLSSLTVYFFFVFLRTAPATCHRQTEQPDKTNRVGRIIFCAHFETGQSAAV